MCLTPCAGLVYASGVFLGTEKFSRATTLNMSLIAFGVVVCAMGETNLVFKGMVQQLTALQFEVRAGWCVCSPAGTAGDGSQSASSCLSAHHVLARVWRGGVRCVRKRHSAAAGGPPVWGARPAAWAWLMERGCSRPPSPVPPCPLPHAGNAADDGAGADEQQGPGHESHPEPVLRVARLPRLPAGALQ